MIHLLRKTTRAFTFLLLLLAGTGLFFPQALDLGLCLGKDGHVDVSLAACRDNMPGNLPSDVCASIYFPDHHGECIDVVMNCGPAQEIVHARHREKSPAKTPAALSASADVRPTQYNGLKSPRALCRPSSFAHLLSLRSVVLLI